MSVVAAVFLGSSLLLPSHPAVTYVRPARFGEWFREAREGTLRIPGPVERRARGFRYVFVEGFQNERMPGYFAQNARELRAHGVPRDAIHVIRPSSHRTTEENLDPVGAAFRAIAREGPERLVVIAHSRGACDALAFALRNPRFVRDRVEALFLVQGPFGGTALADYVLGEGIPMDRRMPVRHRLVAYLLGRLERLLVALGRHGGLADLTRDASRRTWEQELADHRDAIPAVAPRTVFVTGWSEPARSRLLRRATAWYLQTYYGTNDGLVLLEDQCLEGLGACVELADLGHTDLTHRFPASFAGRKMRKALVRSVLMAVGRPGPGTRPDRVGD